MTSSIPDPQAVLEQLEEIKRKYLEAQTDVASVRATGFDQDRKVSVTVLGLGEVSDIKIDPAAVNPADVDGLQRRILQAFRSANNQARDLAAQILSPLNIELPAPEPEPDPEPAQQPAAAEPTLSAPSLSSPALSAPEVSSPSLSGSAPSLSPGISLSPSLSASATVPDLSLPELPEAPAPAPVAEAAPPVVEAPAPAAETAPPEPARPSLANYRHHRPRW